MSQMSCERQQNINVFHHFSQIVCVENIKVLLKL